MSLVITLADAGLLCVAADTRAVSTETGPLRDPVDKLKVLKCAKQSIVVAVAGDSEIDGRHLFEYVEELKEKLISKAGVEILLQCLSEHWEHDVATFRWDSEVDKDEYIEKAKLTVLVVTAFNSLYLVNGKFRDLAPRSFQPPQTLLAFGMPELVQDYLIKEPTSREEWMPFLANVFRAASRSSEYVAPPVDIILWTAKDEMSWRRFDDCDILARSPL